MTAHQLNTHLVLVTNVTFTVPSALSRRSSFEFKTPSFSNTCPWELRALVPLGVQLSLHLPGGLSGVASRRAFSRVQQRT